MRVVLLLTDSALVHTIEQHIERHDPPCEIAGSTTSATECYRLLDDFVPEILITDSSSLIPLSGPADVLLPVVIALGKGFSPQNYRFVTVPLPLEEHQLTSAINRAYNLVLCRKMQDICMLVDSYRNQSAEGNTVVVVDDGEKQLTISPEEIAYVKASGNYVSISTQFGSYRSRSTLKEMATRLQPAGFVRIHRCYLVNQAFIVKEVVLRNNLCAVHLTSGEMITVGPDFRGTFRAMHSS